MNKRNVKEIKTNQKELSKSNKKSLKYAQK